MHTLAAPRSGRRTALRSGVVLSALLAAADLVGAVALGIPNAPLPVNLITFALIAGTLVGLPWAWQGRTWAIWLVAVTRFLSALSLVPLLLIGDAAPAGAVAGQLPVTAVSLLAVALVLVGLRSRDHEPR